MDGFKKAFEELRKQPMFVRITTLRLFQNEIENEIKMLEEEFGITDERSFVIAYIKSAFESMLKGTGWERQEEPEKEEAKEESEKNDDIIFDGLKLRFESDGTINWEVED